MSKNAADLSNFIASKKDAAPAPLRAPEPEVMPEIKAPVEAKQTKLTSAVKTKKPEEKPEMVLLNVRVTAAFRRELKLYAAQIDKDMQEVVQEGIALHRQKHGYG